MLIYCPPAWGSLKISGPETGLTFVVEAVCNYTDNVWTAYGCRQYMDDTMQNNASWSISSQYSIMYQSYEEAMMKGYLATSCSLPLHVLSVSKHTLISISPHLLPTKHIIVTHIGTTGIDSTSILSFLSTVACFTTRLAYFDYSSATHQYDHGTNGSRFL